MLLENIKPFVRYSRILDADIKKFDKYMKAYDSRLYYCTNGNGRIQIGEQIITVKKGTLLLWRAGIPYRYTALQESTMQFIAINFDFTYERSNQAIPIPPEQAAFFDESHITDTATFSDILQMNSYIILDSVPEMNEKFEKIQYEYNSRKNYYAIRCSGILTDLLASIALYIGADDKKDVYNTTVNEIIAFLDKNYQKKLTNRSIGLQFGYHPNYINQLITRYTGKSLHKYLLEMRIHKSIQLLQDTNMPITEIAFRSGFNNYAHFSKYFKQITGASPSRLKKGNKSNEC